MIEIAFTVDKQSDFYKEYFEAKAEKQKFHNYARAFFEKHNLVDSANYYMTDFLGMQLSAEQKERFGNQLKKYDDKNGMSLFKKNSPMQKQWTDEVVGKVNMKLMDTQRFWWLYYVSHGRYALWDNGAEIFGYLSDKYRIVKLPDYFNPIKMSEYYLAVEATEQGG